MVRGGASGSLDFQARHLGEVNAPWLTHALDGILERGPAQNQIDRGGNPVVG